MKAQELRAKVKASHINDVCRYIIAVTLIFSGFVKTIDPWGTALMLEEYFSAFGWEGLKPAAMVLGIWLCAAELMMGCMLFFAVRLRLITLFCVITMTIFTGLTLWLAIAEPIADCGCFGNALKMTNWQSFAKNAVILPMSVLLWWSELDRRFFPFTKLEGLLTVLFASMAGLLGVWFISLILCSPSEELITTSKLEALTAANLQISLCPTVLPSKIRIFLFL